jgi:hypothetical protein
VAIRPSVRFEIFKRDQFTCRYCGNKSPKAILEIDHLHPLSAGGTDDPENLITACYECNRGKGARLLSDVPPEENLHEKAVLIAEQELQIRELNHWRSVQMERQNAEMAALFDYWNKCFDAAPWNKTSVRRFIKNLGYHPVAEAIEAAVSKFGVTRSRAVSSDAFRYFCGCCWKQIKREDGDE